MRTRTRNPLPDFDIDAVTKQRLPDENADNATEEDRDRRRFLDFVHRTVKKSNGDGGMRVAVAFRWLCYPHSVSGMD